MYNYNNNTAANNINKNNNKTEDNKMDEIRMATLLEKLDKSGNQVELMDCCVPIKSIEKQCNIGFTTDHQIAHKMIEQIKNNNQTALNMIKNGNLTNLARGVGLMIAGETITPELVELMSYLTQNQQEGASLVRFCQKCLLAGNVPVRKVVDVVDKDCGEEYLDNSVYFICSNGKVLIRNGEEFEVVYEGVVLPNLQTMSDEECLDVIRSAVETYANLVEQGRDDEDEDYEGDENEDYDDDDEYDEYDEEDNEDREEECEYPEGRTRTVFLTAQRLLSMCTPEARIWVENILADIRKADHNDDIIRRMALVDALEGWIKAYQNQKEEEPKCGYEDDGQQNWIF